MATVDLEWRNPKDDLFSGVEIYKSHNNRVDWIKVGSTGGEKFTVEKLPSKINIWFAAVTVMKNGSRTPIWASPQVSKTCYEQVNKPAAPTKFTVVQNGTNLDFSWVNPTDPDFSHCEIRQATWANGKKIGKDLKEGKFSWAWYLSGTTLTFTMKSFDTTNNESTGYVETRVYIRSLDNYVVDDTDTYATSGGWGGTLTNVETTASDHLVLSAVPEIAGLTDDIAGYTFDIGGTYFPTGSWTSPWTDLGGSQTFRTEIDNDPSTSGTVSMPDIANLNFPIGGVQNSTVWQEDGEHFLSAVKIAGDENAPKYDIQVDIATTASTVPTAQGFKYFLPGDYYCRHYRYKVILYSRWGLDRPRIRVFTIKKWLKNKKIEGVSVGVPTTGWTVDFGSITSEYSFVNAPEVFARVVGATPDRFVRISNITAASFDVAVEDNLGVGYGGLDVSFIAAGT